MFSTGGGKSLAEETNIPFLGKKYLFLSSIPRLCGCEMVVAGRIPLDPRLAQCLESGLDYSEQNRDTPVNTALSSVVHSLIERTTLQSS